MKRSPLTRPLAHLACVALALTLHHPAGPHAAEPPPADLVKFAGLSPQDAAREATAPPGFSVKLFAGEPDVQQPIACALDDRGRLWVAEAYTYPRRAPEGQGKDRILILHDTDGDHTFDRRTVFMEGLNLISGLEVGFGGVWIGAAPHLMFIPDRDGDDRPDGPPQILLDGWDYLRDTHETLNTFTWGPDGWLYGCHGVFCPSFVGKPGTAPADRQRVDAAVWRFHPTRQVFEVFAEGTSNPWGVDFDERGQCIIEACVIPHLWHMIQGGRYQRQGGQHYNINLDEQRRHLAQGNTGFVNPYIYDDIKTIGDHLHYAGDQGPHAGNNRSDSAGGGHAHAGLMVYLGDSWPASYRGMAFMNNIHGQRINVDALSPRGSGLTGSHAPDFVNFNDRWSQILNLISDQDGSVLAIDWYDKNQCHHNTLDGHDRSNGRIFKIVYGQTPVTQPDLAKKASAELVQLQLHPNEWHVRHARRLLQERGPDPAVHTALHRILQTHADPLRKLRALWALHVTRGLNEATALSLLGHSDEFLRAWTLQLICEESTPSTSLRQAMARLARTDSSPLVRLYLLSAAQRFQPDQRWDLLAPLLARGDDDADHNIPLMAWYAFEPMVPLAPDRALDLAAASKLPRILEFAIRRAASINSPIASAGVTRVLAALRADSRQLEALNGLTEANRGRKNPDRPPGWDAVESALGNSPNPHVRVRVQTLALAYGSPQASSHLATLARTSGADPSVRRMAVDSLVGSRQPSVPALLRELLSDAPMRPLALRGLAAFDDPSTPRAVLAVYPSLRGGERRDAINTLASRASYAAPLLAAVGEGTVPRSEITADILRQLRTLRSDEIVKALEKVWGVVRESSADKQREIERYKGIFRAGGSTPGEATRGRAVYAKACQQCHKLFDSGGLVGPDLTGSNRSDLDYILQNMVDPNAVIPNEYRASNIELKDGRSITGIVKQQDDRAVTVATQTETLTLPRPEIESLHTGELSMMPEGLLAPLTDQEVRDLIYYLSRPGQVPLPPTNP